MASKDGRIQDLLLLFTKSPQAPMSGIVSFTAKISLPPEKRPCLEKVELQGDFGVDAGSFTKPDTQRGVNRLGQGALGDKDHKSENEDTDSQNVLSGLKGHILLRNAFPGAWAATTGYALAKPGKAL
jgi:hypothetical protein